MFGANAGSVYASQYPGVEAGQAMSAQSTGIQAGAQEEQANNILNVGNYNASLATLQGIQAIGNTQETYNASGVLPEGSPLAQVEQTRALASQNVQMIQGQAGLQANLENTQANQTINAGRSALLGISNQYTQGLASADIQQEDTADNDLSAIFGIGSSLVSTGANVATAGKALGFF